MDDQPAFRQFIDEVTRVVSATDAAAPDLPEIGRAAQKLVARDDWLPPAATVPHPQFYQQYLLYCDPDERFSVVSFVWGVGQSTPVHDHMTWGIIAMLKGAEHGERFAQGTPMRLLRSDTLQAGDLEFVSPALGDIHRVSNACADQVSISIHVYGGNIGRIARHVYDPETGTAKSFVSGYANADTATRGFAHFPDQA